MSVNQTVSHKRVKFTAYRDVALDLNIQETQQYVEGVAF